MTMDNTLNPIIEEAQDDLMFGSIAGSAIGLGLTYMATRDRTCAGNVAAGLMAVASIAAAKNASDADLVRFRIAGGNKITSAVGTVVMTAGAGLLANLIFGNDAE